MNTNKNNIPFSASDIEKYRKGELSAGEMHDLEQAALDDPFLADAIDGLIRHPISPEDYTDLRDRLNKKVTEDPRRAAILLIRRRITIAAAVILVLGIGFTFFYRYPQPHQKTEQPAPPAVAKAPEPAAPATQFKASAGNTDSTRIAFTQPRTARSTQTRRHIPASRESANVPSANVANAGVSSAASPQSSTERIAEADDKLRTLHALTIEKDSATVLSPKKALSTTQFYNFRPTEPLVYTGKVLDINNRPLAGASLTFKGNPPSGTTTDNEGFFKLSLPRADTTLQLTVSMVGYNQTSLALNDLSAIAKASNVIYLKPSNAGLNEVVVSGYGTRRMATEATAPAVSNERLDTSWNSAAPVIGRPAYLQYLQFTKGKLCLDTTVTGTETVSFLVSRDGSLSSFKIEQSLSPAHDAAIIRLIKDGPAWRLIRNKKIRAAVTVNF